jgi:outer membrane protein assembly factor BamB
MMFSCGRCLATMLILVASVSTQVPAADWPQYRHDAARSGYTSENLGDQLSLQWRRETRHRPHRAWVGRKHALSRMRFDWITTPVATGGMVYFGSSADHKVYALDAATGQERWSFLTEGPVRLAPAVWKDRVLFGSDDGTLYCLDRETGKTVWTRTAGPRDERLIGNGRMISRWAIRGGVAVRDGIAYFGAGNWPEEGVYIRAVEVASGRTVWRNDNTGALEIDQPHMVCFSRGGVIAQGYIAVTKDIVFVATGRSTPAAFDRDTGSFRYYHLSRYGGKTPWGIGGGDIVAGDKVFFNSGLFFDTDTGLRYSDKSINSKWWARHVTPDKRRPHGEFDWGPRQNVVFTPEGIVRYDGNRLFCSSIGYRDYKATRDVPTAYSTDRLTFLGMADEKHKTELIDNAPTPRDKWTATLPAEPASLIVAGDKAVYGLKNRVCMMDMAGRKQVWQETVDATARALAVADGRLLVATDSGAIYCFGTGGKGDLVTPPPPLVDRSAEALAADVLKESGVRKGYCLVIAEDSALIQALVRQSDLYVVALAGAKAHAMRRTLDAAGIYGVRCAVLQTAVSSLPDYFANLVVTTDVATDVDRVLRPFGGVRCSVAPAGAQIVMRRGPLEGAGEWTHNFGNAGNTLYSGDTVARGPLGMLWYEDETQRTIDRHGKNSAPLAYQGLLLRLGIDSLVCRDAYNGAIHYKIELPGVLAAYMEGTQVGAAHIGNTYCVSDDVLYIRMNDECRAYDVFTGTPIRSFRAPAMTGGKRGRWGYVACRDGVLVGGLMNEAYVIKANHGQGTAKVQKPMGDHLTESNFLFAFDARNGKQLWVFAPEKSIRNNTVALGDGVVYLIDREVAAMDRFLRTEIRKLSAAGRLPEHETGKLLALDTRTGEPVWQSDRDVFGTLLAADPDQDVLVMSYYHVGFQRPSESRNKLRVYRASTGKMLWEQKRLGSRPAIGPGTLYTFPIAYDLKSGKTRVVSQALPDANVGDPWKIEGKGQGCGTVAASKHLLMIRSATLGYYDLNYDRKWLENYGGMRAGCFINYLPAMGLVLVPEDTVACRCSYQNQATIALKQYGVRPPVVEPVPGQKNFKYFPRSREPFFTGSLKVRLWHERPDLEIRYTTDNSQPNAGSTLYKAPIELAETTSIRAAVFKDGVKVEVKDAVVFRKTDDIGKVMKQGMKR